MTSKDKIILILLSIITLGIYPLIILRKKDKKTNNELSTSNKVVVNITSLKKYLGDEKNIVYIEFTHTKVKFGVKDMSLVDKEKIENLKGISGLFLTSRSITIIVGNSAKTIARSI